MIAYISGESNESDFISLLLLTIAAITLKNTACDYFILSLQYTCMGILDRMVQTKMKICLFTSPVVNVSR